MGIDRYVAGITLTYIQTYAYMKHLSNISLASDKYCSKDMRPLCKYIDVLMHACIYVCIASEPVFPIIFNVHKVFSLYSFHQHIHAVGMAPFGFILEDESKVWIALHHLRSAYACVYMYVYVY